MIEKFVAENMYVLEDNRVRELCYNGTIGIHYATNNYSRSVYHILELREAIKADYPDIEDSEMDIWVISSSESIRHANYTTLFVQIPLDDYFKLKESNKINIR